MSKLPRRNHLSDLRGAGRLAVDATVGLADLVEALHARVASSGGADAASIGGLPRGLSAFVYSAIRGATRAVGSGVDIILAQLAPLLVHEPSSKRREAVIAALNGVLGDHLALTGNPFAIPMRLRRGGRPLELTPEALSAAIPDPAGRVVVLVHGLCLNDLQWQRDGHDHGAALERDAAAAAQPLTALYLHYNSGLHVFANGRELAQVLEALTQAWPVPLTHLTLVGHSMGGLVVRSACAQARAGQEWPSRLREALFLGTPHAGAPLERAGHRIDRLLGSNAYTAVFARLGRIRSAGITDLRHGSILDAANGSPGARATVPLPEGVACYAIGGSIGLRPDELRERVLGDGLVPVASALGLHAGPDAGPLFAPARRATAQDVNHFGLLGSRRAYGRMRDWLLASETTLQEEGGQG